MSDISIRIVTKNKKDYLPLLLLGDELESDIDTYLERGELFVLYDGDVKSVCVVTDEGGGILEVQNLATDRRCQRMGYASRLLAHIAEYYAERYDKIILGTGEVPGTLLFYKKCGYVITHRIPDYFTEHFDYPIIEEGVTLKDKVYLEKLLPTRSSVIPESDKERLSRIYPIVLGEYSPAWPQWFAEEQERLGHLIGAENIVRISHIGSTAVPGLTAKPTVDILLEIHDNVEIEKLIAALPDNEYICLREQTVDSCDCIMFLKGYLPEGFAERVYHIHVRYFGGNPRGGDWDELYFRDYLIAHPEAASEYAELKKSLLEDFEHDRDGYTNAKGEFVRETTKKARIELSK